MGVAPLATSAVYHRQDAPFLTFPPAGGGKGHGRSGRASQATPAPPAIPPPRTRHSGPAPVIPAKAGNHVTPSPRGFDVSPPPRKGEGQGGGRSSCDQCRLPRQDAPFLTFPPAGEGTRRFGKSVPRHPRPTRRAAIPPPRTRHSGPHPSFRRKPESTHPHLSGFRCFPSPSQGGGSGWGALPLRPVPFTTGRTPPS